MVIIMCSQRFPQFPRNKSKVVAFFSFSSGYIFLLFTEFKLSLRVRPTEGADFLQSSQITGQFLEDRVFISFMFKETTLVLCIKCLARAIISSIMFVIHILLKICHH